MTRARKRFGQHFLERPWAEKLVRAIDPGATDRFLEIGSGRGALTRPLAAASGHLLAFEVDRELAAAMRGEAIPRVTVVEGDFLDVTAGRIRAELAAAAATAGPLRVAGNLPYNAAVPILFKLAALYEDGLTFVDATVMVQREVADRLLARPGSRDYGVLGILIGQRATVERVLELPPGAFRPPPKVHSAVLRLRFHEPAPRPLNQARFETLTRAVFTRRRKTLANALLASPGTERLDIRSLLAECTLDPSRRPETLTLSELVRLADAHVRLVAR
jgi:16S rRNA (adenine1518-N6/adenine1519-N6)-dimethyltransferase